MKKLLLSLFVATLMSTPALADQFEGEEEVGIGADFVVYESSSKYLDKITVETKYDISNENSSAFVVAEVNLFDLLKGE